MSIEIKVPALPESVNDATLVVWHKRVGDSIARGENLADLETDKVVLEIPAPVAGKLSEIRVANGTVVIAGAVLAVLQEGEAAADTQTAPAADLESAAPEIARKVSDAPGKTSPAVRRLLDEHDLDATMVPGTGKQGRITKADVMMFLKSDDSSNVTPGDPAPLVVDESEVVAFERREQRVPMTRLRTRIAERMVEAQQSAAMLTTFNEVDLTAVMAMRGRYRDTFQKEHGVRLGFMSFFAKASVEALKKFPVVNAAIEDNDIVYHNYFDIGIAVSSERGLMVPVVHDVDQMNFAQFERALDAMASKVKDGTIGMEELTGGTFTITNGGVFGSMLSTPILNQPQSAILGMHAIQERPMVIDGDIVVRPMMYVALTYDHRIIDGREAVQFLVSIKQQLEDPGRLLLQI